LAGRVNYLEVDGDKLGSGKDQAHLPAGTVLVLKPPVSLGELAASCAVMDHTTPVVVDADVM